MKQVKPCPFECNANDCKDCGAYTYSHHTQTNEEWFDGLSTEEKAKFFAGIINTNPCGYLLNCNECSLNDKCKEDDYPTSAEAWAEWLKQPHTNE